MWTPRSMFGDDPTFVALHDQRAVFVPGSPHLGLLVHALLTSGDYLQYPRPREMEPTVCRVRCRDETGAGCDNILQNSEARTGHLK